MNTLEQYFILSDIAGKDSNSFDKLIALFADDAIIDANDGKSYQGRGEIQEFFKHFFQNSTELKHVWTIVESDKEIIVSWGVVGKRSETGDIFTLTGKDVARINDEQKIIYLQVIGDNA